MSAISPQSCTAEFTAALIHRDITAATTLLTDDVVFFYSNGTTIIGKEAFASLMTSSWKLIERYSYSTLDSTWIMQSDAAAAIIYSFAWSGAVGEREVNGDGRGTRVFSNTNSGWLIAHEHLSAGQWRPS